MATTVGRATYEEDIGASDAAWKAVYRVAVYNTDDAISQLQYASDAESFISELGKIPNKLEGLQILKVDVNRNTRLSTHPMENGQRIADNKVIEPTKITITGMCDNKRGEITHTQEKKNKGLLKSLVDELWYGSDFKAEQQITSLASVVYAKLEQMLAEREFVTYTISTKGAVYSNMMLVGIDQLNDPEHILTIPVTLRFEECILPGQDSVICANVEDVDITMGGSMHEKGILPAMYDDVKEALSFGD